MTDADHPPVSRQDRRSQAAKTNPIPPLLATAPPGQLQWFMDWFGLMAECGEARIMALCSCLMAQTRFIRLCATP